MTFKLDELLLIRALNATRPLYFPTYAALRVLGEHRPKSGDGLLARSTLRKLKSGDRWRYRPFQMYKGTNAFATPEQHEYRKCLAPSPVTAIADALILQLLSTAREFAVPERVFSYRWPRHPRSGWSYQYFATGYRERNEAISVALVEEPKSVAVVADLKSFYPSVEPKALLLTLERLLARASGDAHEFRREILQFVKQLFDASPQGIPIGPGSGHFLGHIALREVDQLLIERFGGRYFRYVDDIVVVVSRETRRQALAAVSAAVAEQGMLLNESKTAFLDAQHWQTNVHAPDLQFDDSFSAFTSDLATHLAFHSANAEILKQQFLQAGFSIPVSRLLALSRYSRFRYFLRQRGRLHAASLFFTGVATLVDRARALRSEYERALERLRAEGITADPTLQRWRSQRARRVVNALFYLWSPQAWKSQMGVFESFPDLVEQRALATALSTGNVVPILPFYGRGPAAFAEIWNEHSTTPADFDWPSTGLANPEIESLVTLTLMGAVRVPEEISRNQSEWHLLRLGASNAQAQRTRADLTYDDEVESLTLNLGREEIAALVKSRYAVQESSVLDALALLGSEYRS
jgi:hypothetical protein